jgi:ABC-type multidrug transport system ATPase subunit/ABC-type polysaccharide/polyol phosphate export permease
MSSNNNNNNNIDNMPVGDIEDAIFGKESTEKTTDSGSRISIGTKGEDLVWSGINLKLMDKKKKGEVKLDILKDVWGTAEAGKTTAIMGASGAGKTSLFQVLTGRLPTQGDLVEEGEIYLGGVKVDPRNREHRKLFGYVAQEDSLHETSTPREALRFSAKLRLPKTTTDEEIESLVNTKLKELGLEQAADTIIGGGFKKGISGGQKKRVSIGVELIANPTIIFLDEPTSGLDSYAAAQVMHLLDDVAKAGNIVLFTIHQPSSKVFSSFDNLLLLNKGQIMHQGSVANIAADFDTAGFPMPENYNPADWVIDVSEMNDIDALKKTTFFASEPKEHKIVPKEQKLEVPDQNHVGILTELKCLLQREFRDIYRNPLVTIIGVTITSILAAIFGLMFWDVGRKDRSETIVVQAVLGALVNLMISTLFGQSNTAISMFARDRPLFLREYSTDHYSIVPYFVSKLGTEAFNSFSAVFAQALVVYWMMGFTMGFGYFLAITYALALVSTAVCVMLGAFFADPEHATALFTIVVVPQMYFSGIFIAIDLLPEIVQWAQYLCSLTYASRLALAYELQNCEPGLAQQNCEYTLARNNVSVDNIWWYWLALLGLFIGFRLIAMIVLRSKAKY